MEVIFCNEEMPYKFKKSLFLAGPSRRADQEEFDSWRKDALKILEDIGFDGIVICPENRGFKPSNEKDFDHDKQIAWEQKYLDLVDCILFWMPRDLSIDKTGNIKLPGLTSNIEFGKYCDSGRVVFGAPEDAEKILYMKHEAEKYNIPVGITLTETINHALEMLGEGAERELGERFVPLYIWNTPNFQSWYHAQLDAGNRLEHAQLLYNFRPRYKENIFLWILKVNVYVASEDRFKDNEFVLSRPDIASVMLWKKNENIYDSEIVLIKEFRSPAATSDGFIYELPSGSSLKATDPEELAEQEVSEETGFNLIGKKLKFHAAKQLAGTLSSHKSHLFSYELSEEDLKWFKSQKGIPHGNIKDTERTFIEVFTLKEILKNKIEMDYSGLGMILSIAFEN